MMTTEELLAAVQDKAPPAPPDRLAAFESAIGCPLPEDYRRFLVACNGGYASGKVLFLGTAPEGGPVAGVHHVGGFREDYATSLEARRVGYQTGNPPPIPRDLIWIMDDPSGNPICLGIAGGYRGQVYFGDHERGPDPDTWDGRVESAGCFTRLTDSFAAFVAGLCPRDGP
jgi:hypothetical protein